MVESKGRRDGFLKRGWRLSTGSRVVARISVFVVVLIAVVAVGGCGSGNDARRSTPQTTSPPTTTTQPDPVDACAVEVRVGVAFLLIEENQRGSTAAASALDELTREHGYESIEMQAILALYPQITITQFREGTVAAGEELRRLARPACENAVLMEAPPEITRPPETQPEPTPAPAPPPSFSECSVAETGEVITDSFVSALERYGQPVDASRFSITDMRCVRVPKPNLESGETFSFAAACLCPRDPDRDQGASVVMVWTSVGWEVIAYGTGLTAESLGMSVEIFNALGLG